MRPWIQAPPNSRPRVAAPGGERLKSAIFRRHPDSDPSRVQIDLPDLDGTAALAARLARLARPGDCIALRGDLGAGKTELARAFLRAAGVVEDVPSPTFALVQPYDTDLGPVAHFDLYRIEDPSELDELGFDAALDDGIVLVEWPDRLGSRLPADRLDVTLTLTAGSAPPSSPEAGSAPPSSPEAGSALPSSLEAGSARRAELIGHGSWSRRLAGLSIAGSSE